MNNRYRLYALIWVAGTLLSVSTTNLGSATLAQTIGLAPLTVHLPVVMNLPAATATSQPTATPTPTATSTLLSTPTATVTRQPTETTTPIPTVTTPSLYICSHNAYNCADFDSQAEAQAVFDYCMDRVGFDVHQLDRDNDGEACEALPRRVW